jgi:hypothetical protein
VLLPLRFAKESNTVYLCGTHIARSRRSEIPSALDGYEWNCLIRGEASEPVCRRLSERQKRTMMKRIAPSIPVDSATHRRGKRRKEKALRFVVTFGHFNHVRFSRNLFALYCDFKGLLNEEI